MARVKALGRTLFMGYAVAMAFTLVYTAEHYVFDIILGWALAGFVILVAQVVDRRWLIPRKKQREQQAGAESAATTEAAESDSPVSG